MNDGVGAHPLHGLERRVVHDPTEDVSRHSQRVVVALELFYFYQALRGSWQRLQAVVVQFPGRFFHARPLELR